MSQQKASVLPVKQGKLEIQTRPIPTPQANQVLVKVTAAAINPGDWKIIETGILVDKFPAILGWDGAGIVESVGPDVTTIEKGDRVVFQGFHDPIDLATYQQYALADTNILARTPSNITDDQASTVPVGSVTAFVGLFQKSGIPFPKDGPTAVGKSILVLGGSSSVGQFGIQLARIAGFSPIITTASSQHTGFLRSLGATHVFDRNVNAKTLQEAFGGPVTLILDAISVSSTQKLVVDVVKFFSSGAHLAYVLPLEASVEKQLQGKATLNHIFGSSHVNKELTIPYWQALGKWLEEGKIVPNHVQVVKGGLAAIPKAHELSKQGVSGVKLVVHPQE